MADFLCLYSTVATFTWNEICGMEEVPQRDRIPGVGLSTPVMIDADCGGPQELDAQIGAAQQVGAVFSSFLTFSRGFFCWTGGTICCCMFGLNGSITAGEGNPLMFPPIDYLGAMFPPPLIIYCCWYIWACGIATGGTYWVNCAGCI
ncbi:hypothetical protein FGO68_gene1970 [Halteria grandinella]|uniref:Uncharacterized protein n=1 Tax=Halteria grandinella TaxID=5974 RepID=A0A8J8NMF8_HALGN|nr:hypothetical protein FGO68_gene1970 [Halteria grandinella]